MCDQIKEAFYFETRKLVTVKSVKLGVLFRTIQLLIVIYIVVYSVVLQKGYREFSPLNGVLYTKAKGTVYTNNTEPLVFDSQDLVVPPMEANAIFITTMMETTKQSRGTCLSTEKCSSDENCIGKNSTVGKILPTCNTTAGLCLIAGWCPLETEGNKLVQMNGYEMMTIFLRSSVEYTHFEIGKSDPAEPILGRNLFYLKDMLNTSKPEDCYKGCLFIVDVNWNCDLDHEQCSPKITFDRRSGTFNFRLIEYSESLDERTIVKLYGVRYMAQFSGRGARFSWFALLITIGSGLGFFAVATLIVDVLMLIIFNNSDDFQVAKWVKVKIVKEEVTEKI